MSLGVNFHYVGIYNLNRLLNMRDCEVRISVDWCPTCLHGFRHKRAFEKHVGLCQLNVERTTLYTYPEEKFVQFQDWSKTIPSQFVVYADFESVLSPDNEHHQKHLPIAAGLVLIHHNKVVDYRHFVGEDCGVKFL